MCSVFLFYGQDHSHGVRVPIHGKAERENEVAQLEVVIAADGVGGEGKRIAVEVDSGARERGGLIAGGQGGLLAADRGVGGLAGQVNALLCGVPLDLKIGVQTVECFRKIAQLEVVAAVDGVRSQISLCAVERYLVGRNLCGRVGELAQGSDGVCNSTARRVYCPFRKVDIFFSVKSFSKFLMEASKVVRETLCPFTL